MKKTDPTPPAPDGAPRLPYFDMLLALLEGGDSRVATAFGRHVHWGYWPDPARATGEASDYAEAAERLSREICDAGNVRDGQTVLDVGCGFGGTIAGLNERLSGMQLVGLNVDRRQLRRARETVTARPGNTIEFLAGTASSLPLPDASCDTVLAVEAIFHFPDRAQFFREAHRVLKPGGRLALTDFVPQRWLQPLLRSKIPFFHFGDCNVGYGVQRYRRLAADTGFRPVVERDINANVLPTYAFLETLQPAAASYGKQVVLETRGLHWLSRMRLLRYSILAFEKDGAVTAA